MRIRARAAALVLLAASSAAWAIEFEPFPDSQITAAQWNAYYQDVAAAYGASVRQLPDQHLVTFDDNAGGVHYAFTRPGHPAHPAWITRKIIQDPDGKLRISQVGFFAGNEAPFAGLFREYQGLNDKILEEIRRGSDSK